jgi:hypothetical protein
MLPAKKNFMKTFFGCYERDNEYIKRFDTYEERNEIALAMAEFIEEKYKEYEQSLSILSNVLSIISNSKSVFNTFISQEYVDFWKKELEQANRVAVIKSDELKKIQKNYLEIEKVWIGLDLVELKKKG